MNPTTRQTQIHRKDFNDNYDSVSWTSLLESFQLDWGLIHFFVLKNWLETPIKEIPRGSWTL